MLTPQLGLRRRAWLLGALQSASTLAWAGNQTQHLPLHFPRDHGAHPDFRTEWWYLTGFANTSDRDAAFGFQLTFFRSRVAHTQDMQSRLAARQLVFAHAAITDVAGGTLRHDQRIARSSGMAPGRNPTDRATYSSNACDIQLQDWSLQGNASEPVGGLRASAVASDFSLQLELHSDQPVLLQGDAGWSRKGPGPEQASYYYSQPQLRARGELQIQGKRHTLAPGSTAWLDHEWSQEMMHPRAVGWDWIGINMFDGSALTAFRLRDRDGAALWDGGSYRNGERQGSFTPGEVSFTPLRYWVSPLSRARYPVEWSVHTPTDSYTVRAVVDGQELDSRASTGAIYWEGLCEVWNSQRERVGRGYLEMTGYAAPIRF